MIKLKDPPAPLEKYLVTAYQVSTAYGMVGSVTLDLSPRQDSGEPILADHAELQQVLGKDFELTIGETWTFHGVADALEYVSSTSVFKLDIKDALVKLEKTFASRVFAECKFSDIAAEICPDAEMVGKGGDQQVKLAIQYNESDLDFLRRILNDVGCQIWCNAGTVYMGDEASGDKVRARLGVDLIDYTISTELGPEEANVTSYQYLQADRPDKVKSTFEGGGEGDVQKGIADIRKKTQGDQSLHIIEEEAVDSASDSAREFLRRYATGRFRLTGVSHRPMPLGAPLEIVNSEAGGREKESTETCMIRKVFASWHGESPDARWDIEAVNTEAFLDNWQHLRGRIFKSTAIVHEANDEFGRVKVYFPWDPNETTSPWLRMSMPAWGDGHGLYMPPNIGDMVLVMWGQVDMEPVVIGAVSAGDAVETPDDLALFKTVEGHTIQISGTSMLLHNESDGGDTKIEILPDSVVITTKNGQSVTMGSNALTLDDGSGGKIEVSSGKILIEGSSIEISADSIKIAGSSTTIESGSGAAISLSGPTVDINSGALEVT